MKIKKIALGVLLLIATGFAGYDIGTLIVDYKMGLQEIEKNCPIHSRFETNPPILLNTNNGEIVEMKIFESYNSKISDKKDYGHLSIGASENVFLMSYPDNSYADISINEGIEKYSKYKAKKHLCDKCLSAIKEVNPDTNYIVVDCYDNKNIKYYDLKDIEKEDIKIRHYTLHYQNTDNDYKFKVESNYFEGGKTLDYEKEQEDIGNYYFDIEKGTIYLA